MACQSCHFDHSLTCCTDITATSSIATVTTSINNSTATSDHDGDNFLLNDVSFTSSNGSDHSFEITEQANISKERLLKKVYYYLSSHEVIEPLKTLQLYYFLRWHGLWRERVLLSHINITQPENSSPTAAFSPGFKEIVDSYRRSLAYKVDMSCNKLGDMSEVDKSLTCNQDKYRNPISYYHAPYHWCLPALHTIRNSISLWNKFFSTAEHTVLVLEPASQLGQRLERLPKQPQHINAMLPTQYDFYEWRRA